MPSAILSTFFLRISNRDLATLQLLILELFLFCLIPLAHNLRNSLQPAPPMQSDYLGSVSGVKSDKPMLLSADKEGLGLIDHPRQWAETVSLPLILPPREGNLLCLYCHHLLQSPSEYTLTDKPMNPNSRITLVLHSVVAWCTLIT